MTKAGIKGSTIEIVKGHMVRRIGAEVFEALVSTFEREDQIYLLNPSPNVIYPLHAFGKLFELYTKCLGLEHEGELAELEFIGQTVAKDNLTKVYKAMLSLMSSRGVVPMLPFAWRQYFRGVEVSLHMNKKERTAEMHVTGLGEMYMLGAVASGWKKWALVETGTRSPVVFEHHNYRAREHYAPNLHFYLSW